MKNTYLTILSIAALSFGLNAQVQMDAINAVPIGPSSAGGGNCTVPNMGGALASGFLGWVAGDGSMYAWFDIAGTPGCGMSYPFTLEQVDVGIADPSGFGLPAGSGTGTLTFQINIYDAMTPGDPCTEPGALIASSGNQAFAYADEGLHDETVLFNQSLNNAFFVEWKFISWTGPGPEVPSPLWDDAFRPLCRQWITNDGGTTLLDMTDFFTEGDTGWVDVTIHGTGTAGGGPPNDDCTGAVNQNLNAGGSITFNGDNTGATDDGQGLAIPQVWESFTTTECLDIVIDFCGTPSVFGNAFLNLFDACPFVNFEAADTWEQTTCVDGNWSIFYTNIPAGTWYYAVMSELGSMGPYTLNVSGTACGGGPNPPPNDDCAGAIALTPNPTCISTTGDVTNATESLPAILCNTFTGDANDDIWYSFVATQTAHEIQVTGGTDFDAVVELLEGICTGTISLDCADATIENETEVIMATGLTIGNTYYVRVYHWYAVIPADPTFEICVIGAGGGGPNLSPNFEGFEGADFPPMCWNNLDEDGDSEFWFRAGNPTVVPNSGDSCAVSASWLDGAILTPENYLILPQVTPGVDEHLTYWVAAQDPAYAAEHYGIVVSTTGMAAADFSVELFNETLVDEIWVERTVDLSAYQGMDIYIAFKHYNVSDQFWMKVDDVQWPTETMPCIPTAVIDQENDSDLNIFPNPASGSVTVRNNGNSMYATVELLDMNGKIVLTTVRTFVSNGDEVIDLGGLAPGIYMLSVSNNEGVEMRQRLVIQ